jgi:hypothetical protein
MEYGVGSGFYFRKEEEVRIQHLPKSRSQSQPGK